MLTFAAEFRLSENENESLNITRHVAAWPLQAVTPWLGASPGGSRARFSEAVRFAVVTEGAAALRRCPQSPRPSIRRPATTATWRHARQNRTLAKSTERTMRAERTKTPQGRMRFRTGHFSILLVFGLTTIGCGGGPAPGSGGKVRPEQPGRIYRRGVLSGRPGVRGFECSMRILEGKDRRSRPRPRGWRTCLACRPFPDAQELDERKGR
jgi:hypothetical protein